jgi:hypothetical protein
MSINFFIAIIILVCGLIFCLCFGSRNEWVLEAKLAVFEVAIKKRKRLELEGKKGLLLEEIEKGMWSYDKMMFCFWEKDVSKMFKNEDIKKYIYNKDYVI